MANTQAAVAADPLAQPRDLDWPTTLAVDAGRLSLDGCDLEAVARRFGTPCWVVSSAAVEANYRNFVSTWESRYPEVECAYSMKANNTMSVVSQLADLGSSLDCTGETELQIAILCGVPPERIILNGNGKSPAALRAAAAFGIRQVNVDSLGEAQRLNEMARAEGTHVDCVVRIQLSYRELLEQDPAYLPIARMWEGKFGSSVPSGEAAKVVEYVDRASNLTCAGLHHHVGFSAAGDGYTPELDLMHHAECAREVCEFATEIREQFGVEVDRLDLGGGFPSGRGVFIVTPGNVGDGALHPVPPTEAYADAVSGVVREHFGEDSLPTLQFETGRYQVAGAVLLLTTVSDVKDGHSVPPRRFITVDSSMQQFTSKGFTHTAFQALAVTRQDEPDNGILADVVGQTCAYDSIAEDVFLPDLAVGDVVAFTNQGAYCDTTGTNMNAMPRPAVVLAQEGRASLARRHETLMDISGRDVGPALAWKELA